MMTVQFSSVHKLLSYINKIITDIYICWYQTFTDINTKLLDTGILIAGC